MSSSDTVEKWHLFLEFIGIGCDLEYALKQCDLSKSQFYKKRKNDIGFQDEYEVALENSAVVVEDALRQKAREGDVKAMQTFLKARMGKKYGEKLTIEANDTLERLKDSAKKAMHPGDKNAVAGKTIKGDTVLRDE